MGWYIVGFCVSNNPFMLGVMRWGVLRFMRCIWYGILLGSV